MPLFNPALFKISLNVRPSKTNNLAHLVAGENPLLTIIPGHDLRQL
jgi:hypothetical protein